MEIIISYLVEKGGIFGLLLAISLAWIVFREQQLFNKSNLKVQHLEEQDAGISNITNVIQDIRSNQKEFISHVNETTEIIKELKSLNEDKFHNLNKISIQAKSINQKVSEIEKKTSELWDWHSVKDSDGVPVWYNRKSVENSLGRLDKSLLDLHNDFSDFNNGLRKDLEIRLQKVNDDRIEELKSLLETYNKTVTDLILALEKIKFLLRTQGSIRGDFNENS